MAARQEAAPPIVLVSGRAAGPAAPGAGPRDSIVRFALRQLGTPYVWAGTSPATGFDCSGFITYVFGRFGVATPHATAQLINAGRPVARAQAQPGDIVVFTGTAEGSTTPGHAGIVISALGETPLRFVHASSARRESGVKISQVENSGYERRFMQVRRVLDGEGTSTGVFAASRPAARPAGAVATLPTATPEVASAPTAALPTKLAALPMRRQPRPVTTKTTVSARRHLATKATAARRPAATSHKVPVKKAPSLSRRAKLATRHRPAASPVKTKKH
ncbi:hypothetical protein GCM10023172_34980 [Hymenobacter ginsengisoli]|uniref:NlpC/P60 domain-containing protein n=1 Tax=Hymenobacter ginsengisoli TaxID=1051626 RepID=A0ABP8QRY0_9BACT